MGPGADFDLASGHLIPGSGRSTCPSPKIPISAAVIIYEVTMNRGGCVVATGDWGREAVRAIGIDPH